MPHKMTLTGSATGSATGPLREYDRYVAFDMHEKILIQGEPTLDIPIDEYLGGIGIICFQITVLPNKNDKETNESKDEKEAKQEASALSEA